MTVRIQNLRSKVSGVEPGGLYPGQLSFNLADKIVYIGDGSDEKRRVDGTVSPAPEGYGWFASSVDFKKFLLNPENYEPAPSGGDILTYSDSLEKPVWTDTSTLTLSSDRVDFDPSGSGLPVSDVNAQQAISTAATVAYTAKATAENALPSSGGEMTGVIDFAQGQPVDAGTF